MNQGDNFRFPLGSVMFRFGEFGCTTGPKVSYENVITVEEACNMINEGGVKIGDKLNIRGMLRNRISGLILSTSGETVYNLFEGFYFDTVVKSINGLVRQEQMPLGRFRYFDEGVRCPLPIIGARELKQKTDSELLDKIRRAYQR
jgi:hypothetical protein